MAGNKTDMNKLEGMVGDSIITMLFCELFLVPHQYSIHVV